MTSRWYRKTSHHIRWKITYKSSTVTGSTWWQVNLTNSNLMERNFDPLQISAFNTDISFYEKVIFI